jgi:hypothetical protein
MRRGAPSPVRNERARHARHGHARFFLATVLILAVATFGACGAAVNPQSSGTRIPDVAGKTTRAATAVLRRQGFTVSQLVRYDQDVVSGRVIRTRPRAGARAERSERVTLVVSKGLPPPPITDLLLTSGDLAPGGEQLVTMDGPQLTAEPDAGHCRGAIRGERRAISTMQVGSRTSSPVVSITIDKMGSAAQARDAVATIADTREGCLAASPTREGPTDVFQMQTTTSFSADATGYPAFGFTTIAVPSDYGSPVVAQQSIVTWGQGPYLANVSVSQASESLLAFESSISPYLSGLLSQFVDAQIALIKRRSHDETGRSCCAFAATREPTRDATPVPTDSTPPPSTVEAAEETTTTSADEATIPDVTGLDQAEARTALAGAGFLVSTEGAQSDQPAGTVTAQEPGAGASAPEGSTVTLVVAFN